MNVLTAIGSIIVTFIIAGIVCLWLPGIEKKVEARVQQRIGPNLSSPGLFMTLKFFFKEILSPNARMPKVYNALPFVILLIVSVILIILTPGVIVYVGGATASLIALVGLLKVEEIVYLFMSSFSQSIMSKTMPFPDQSKGGKHLDAKQSFIEQVSASRSLRLISFGSLPFYIALFIPAIMVRSVNFLDIVVYQQLNGAILFTLPGILATIAFFVGFLVIINENPFSYMMGHTDVIQGPLFEYMAKYRAIYTMAHALLIFVGGCIFSTLFLGIPPYVDLNLLVSGWTGFLSALVYIIVPIICSIILAAAASVVCAFSPLFTNREILPTILGTSVVGVLAVVVAFI